ncbi:winged helix-turn-helix domain-containing protein [Chiayiivirga flava]|uniref:DNA-binding winged helix-turn-helix (WHTH) protein/Flp pilus assembly protein TadD n=1 Tax=Chiayiivirga flava TaxID=659595 RepID=A0A7W8D6W6_9GAMM|nr:winged helix-turn-helix domain-containing protein [Chiayiivirga flava]MBB5207885.1 DNA-binding winged helix-turn-helix (wHTH) protein/Flp pilus assembly protein TadD [Chiayiivirga flava]
MSSTTPSRFRLDDLIIDLERQRVTRADAVLDVSGLSFRLLACLLRRGVEVVPFDTLIAQVWAPAVVNEETVTQRVKLLRQALGDDGRQPRYVRSVRGRGYQLCAMPEALADADAEAAGDATAPPRRARAWLAVPVVLVLILAAASAMRGRDPTTPPPTPRDETLERARHYFAMGQRDNNERAVALYEQALQVQPSREARLGLSVALSARVCLYDFPWEQADRARQLAESLIAEDGSDAAAHSARGYALDCLGRIDDAIASYTRAIALDPAGREDSVASLAYLLGVKGQLAEALRLNLSVLDHRSRLRHLDNQIARDLELLGFDVEAEQWYARSFRLQPDNVFANVAWPTFLFRQGRYSEAERAADEALARPHHPELQVLLGQLALLRGDRARAADFFAQAEQARPHLGRLRTLRLLHGEQPATPARIAARIAELDAPTTPENQWPETFLELGWLECARGDTAAARVAIDRAIDAGMLDRASLLASPLFACVREVPGFAAALDRIAARVGEERARVLAAPWLPADLLTVTPSAP